MSEFSATSEDPLKVTIEDVKPVVACRGCLVTEQPLRLLDGQLADAFSMFISTVEEHDIYPKYICMYCRAVLLRFVSFRKKCLSVQWDLTKIVSVGIPITLELIKSNYKSFSLKVTEPLLISVGDENIFIQNRESSIISNSIPQNLLKNEPNDSQMKQEDEAEVEIIADTVDDEIITLSDGNYEDASDISDSEDTDLPDCLRGINSDVYKKDTKQNFKDYSRKSKQVKPQTTKQQIAKSTSTSNCVQTSDCVDMIVDDTKNASAQTLSRTPIQKKPQKSVSAGKVDKHREPRGSGFSVKHMKAWIEKVRSERLKKSNDGFQLTDQPSESKTVNEVSNDYHKQTQDVSNDVVDVKHLDSNSTHDVVDVKHLDSNSTYDVVNVKHLDSNSTHDNEDDCDLNLDEIRNWIVTVRAKRTNQATKKLTKKQKLLKEKILKDKADFEKKCYVKIVEISKDKQMQQIIERKDTDKYKGAKYKCELCFTGFKTKVTYENHMARHKPVEGHVMCDICKKYYRRIKLTAHKRENHKEDYICNICDHISKSRCVAKVHYLAHKGFKYNCKICGKRFDKPNSVHGHVHLVHKQLMVRCSICDRECIGEKGLNAHMNLSHKEAIGAVCASCGVQFHSVSAMQRHRPQGDCDHNHSPCTSCGMGFTSDALLREHESVCECKKEYICDSCNMRFDNVDRYNKHLYSKRHTCGGTNKTKSAGPNKTKTQYPECFVCETCGKSFTIKLTFEVHQRKHFRDPYFYCDYCGKGFYYKNTLTQHIEAKHMGMSKKYNCSYCHRGFDFIGNMRRHVLATHEKLRRFSCDICSKRFTSKVGLQGHVRHTHQGVPWPKRVRNRLGQ